MTIMKTGITPDTFKELLLDEGLLYVDYGLGTQRLLGATVGGCKVEVVPEIRKMTFDGAPGDVKGDKRITGWSVKLTGNIKQFSTNNLLMAMPTFANTPNATHDVLTSTTQIVAGSYYTNITWVGEKSGTTELFYVKISNALALAGFTIDPKEKDESVYSLEFTGHYAQNALGTVPVEIGNPLQTGTGFWTLTYIAGANGQIIGNASQIVADGEDGAPVLAHPDDLYEFAAWDIAVTDEALRHDLAVGADITATATFQLIGS